MPIHSAIFRQPGPELNPIRAKVPTPIAIEVFEIEHGAKYGDNPGTGIWSAREATTQTVLKMVGRQQGAYRARFRVAQLFEKQTGAWKIDGQEEPRALGYHLHLDAGEPSLCGSKHHVTMLPPPAPEMAILLPEVRAGRKVLVPAHWENLCVNCLSLFDRTPTPGDHVRVRSNNKTGILIGLADPHLKPGKAQHYVLKYDDEATRQTDRSVFTAAEIALTMLDKDQPF